MTVRKNRYEAVIVKRLSERLMRLEEKEREAEPRRTRQSEDEPLGLLLWPVRKVVQVARG